MRAISLWQPWASAIAIGSKTIETRHWATSYRGPIAIHAAKRRVLDELAEYAGDYVWCAAMNVKINDGLLFWKQLPYGAIVATATLVDCRPTEDFRTSQLDNERLRHELITPDRPYIWTEREMGDFSPGRFGWVLEDVRRLQKPIPFVGRQGFFSVPDELLSSAHLIAAPKAS